MKKLIHAALALALLSVGPALAQQAPEDAAAKERDVRKLMELTGSAQLGQQVMSQMLASLRQGSPEVPSAFWDGSRRISTPAR